MNSMLRAKKTAKCAMAKDARHQDHHQDPHLPRKEHAGQCAKVFLQNRQGDTCLQRSGRAEEFTEARRQKHKRNSNNKNEKDQIFPPGQSARHPIFLYFGSGYFVQDFLQKSKRTQKTADQSPQK